MSLIIDYLEDESMSDFDASMNIRADELLARPLQHHCTRTGKQFRKKFLKVLYEWFPLAEAANTNYEDRFKTVFNTLLMIDDIQDRSILRNGVPAAYRIYGIPYTLRCTSYALIASLIHRDKICWLSYVKRAWKGQSMEIYWRDNFKCPTMEEYMDMIYKKTATCIHFCVDAYSFSDYGPEDFTDTMNILGRYLQIRDDYLNLTSQQFEDDKGFCEDLTEGKFSYPIVYYINKFPEDGRILNFLKQRTRDVEEKKKFLEILRDHDVLEVTREELERMKQNIISSSNKLGVNDALINLFNDKKF